MSKFIAIEQDGVVEVHASAEGTGMPYATLCGMDGDDDAIGQLPAKLKPGALISCAQCKSIIRRAHSFKEKDFA